MADPNAPPAAPAPTGAPAPPDPMEQAYAALRAANAAGDTASATKLAQYIQAQHSAPPAPPPPPAAAPPEPAAPTTLAGAVDAVGANALHHVEDIAAPIAGGFGTAADVVRNDWRMAHGEPTIAYGGPQSAQAAAEGLLSHAPDKGTPVQNFIDKVSPFIPGIGQVGVLAKPVGAAARYIQNLPMVQRIENSNLGRTLIHDVGAPLASLATAAGSVSPLGPEGETALGAAGDVASRSVGATRDAADAAVNAMVGPSAEARATIAANPRVAEARDSGFRLFGREVGARVNPATPGEPLALPGSTRSAMSAASAEPVIQRHNVAMATRQMTQDVGLPTTRNVVDSEMQAARQRAGAVYDQLGRTVGTQAIPPGDAGHAAFMQALYGAGATGQSEETRQAIAQQVAHIANLYDTEAFDGPRAVQDIRGLRDAGYRQMARGTLSEQAVGRTNINLAHALEDELMRRLPATSDLRTTFPAARTQLAKLNELGAVSEGGQVVPAHVLNLYRNGAPLSGAALRVARTADFAPESMSINPARSNELGYVPVGHYAGARALVRGGAAIVRRLPGMNEATEAFQTRNFGPARTWGPPEAPLPPARPALDLTSPPGSVYGPHQYGLRENTTYSNVPGGMEPAQWSREVLSRIQGHQIEAGHDITVGRSSPLEVARDSRTADMFPPEGGAPWRPPYEAPPGSVGRPAPHVSGTEDFAATRRRQRLGRGLSPEPKP
ncbi:MAG: hypothetical protein KGL39_14785 [Patescibacteria group bacterium]|nr:hypothetical protein [Patescibacteria group bacterium]